MSREEKVLTMRARVDAAIEELEEVADDLDRFVQKRRSDADPSVDAFDELGSALLRLKGVKRALGRMER